MSREARRMRWLGRLEAARRCERDLAAAELHRAQADVDAALATIERTRSGERERLTADRDRLAAARSVADLEIVWDRHQAQERSLVFALAEAQRLARTRDETTQILLGRSARLHAAERMHEHARADLRARLESGERKLLDDLAPIMNARKADR